MKCPYKLNVPVELRTEDECDPECAWLVEDREHHSWSCALAVLAATQSNRTVAIPAIEFRMGSCLEAEKGDDTR